MKSLIIRLTIALIAFIIGIALFSITRPRWSQVSPPAIVKVTDQIPAKPLRQPRAKESPTPPLEGKIPKGTDLSIVVALGDDNPPSFDVRHIEFGKNRQTTIELDLAEHIDGQEIKLHFPYSSGSYRMLQRYRTSMTISDEGPHLDLVDWRHFDSPWTPLESLGANRFRALRSEQMNYTRFPKTTKAEIIKEVRRRGNDSPHQLELVQSCNGPNDGACSVTISSIYLRIQKQLDGRWIDVGMVEIEIPMGC